MTRRRFHVPVADLLGRPGVRRRERLISRLDGVGVTSSRIPASADVAVDVALEWVSDGVLASGTVAAAWQGDCRRCLGSAGGRLCAEVRELFERRPREGESYPLLHDSVDLEPLVRDALLLELPLAPLCSPDCAGLCPTCGVNRNTHKCACEPASGDPRWAVLDVLRVEPSSAEDPGERE